MSTTGGNTETSKAATSIEDLWKQHYESTVRAAQRVLRRRDLAEEAAQQAFAVYMERACAPAPGKEGAYLRQMATNQALTFVRRKNLEDRHLQCSMLVSVSAEDEAMRLVEGNRVRAGITLLPERQQKVIINRHYRGLSEAETAASLGVSPGTVKAHGFRARAALRTVLHEVA